MLLASGTIPSIAGPAQPCERNKGFLIIDVLMLSLRNHIFAIARLIRPLRNRIPLELGSTSHSSGVVTCTSASLMSYFRVNPVLGRSAQRPWLLEASFKSGGWIAGNSSWVLSGLSPSSVSCCVPLKAGSRGQNGDMSKNHFSKSG
jgi:hypothetical protein